MYERTSARRIMAGHLSNLYAGAIDAATCALQLRALGAFGAAGADVELEGMCLELAGLLDVGERPTLVLPELGIQVAPRPEQEVSLSAGAAEQVVTDAEAAELNAKANAEEGAPREPAEQLTETKVAEAGAPAPAPTESPA